MLSKGKTERKSSMDPTANNVKNYDWYQSLNGTCYKV